MQRELDAAAETRAVDRRDRRDRQRTQAREELVARAAPLARAVRCDVGELRDVGAGREEERLAREDGGGEVTALELVERTVE